MQIFDRPQWLTISGGSKTYVERILSRLPTSQLHQGPEAGNVVSVRRATPAERTAGKGRWVVKTKNGKEQEFEEVVMACHADTALRLLELDGGRDPAGDEAVKKALGKFEFSKNVAVLHNDEEVNRSVLFPLLHQPTRMTLLVLPCLSLLSAHARPTGRLGCMEFPRRGERPPPRFSSTGRRPCLLDLLDESSPNPSYIFPRFRARHAQPSTWSTGPC